METTQKNAAPKAATPSKKAAQSKGFTGIKSAGIVILCCFVIAVLFYIFWLGNPSHFVNGDLNNHPTDMWGTVYKGGPVVPCIHTLLLTVIALSIERYIALRSAYGKGSLTKFVENIKAALNAGDLKKAHELCDKQRGSVANVVGATLQTYREMEASRRFCLYICCDFRFGV